MTKFDPTDKSTEIHRRRDALLCFCDEAGPERRGISHDEFRIAVWGHPALSYEELCEKFDVGIRCTACLLNVESAYYEAYRTRPANFVASPNTDISTRKSPDPGEPLDFKRALYRLVDGILPLRPMTRLQILPVIAADGLRTVLTLSNQFPRSIGATCAPFSYRVEIRDGQGQILRRESLVLAPGESRDIDISAPLSDIRGSKEIVTGGCWIYQTPTGLGFLGSTRPHFKLVGKNGVSAVHTQTTNPPVGTHFLARANASERHFIHMTNPLKEIMASTTTVAPYSGPGEETIYTELPPLGSVSIEIPPLDSSIKGGAPFYRITNKSAHRRRAHILIANSDLTTMSADHF